MKINLIGMPTRQGFESIGCTAYSQNMSFCLAKGVL